MSATRISHALVLTHHTVQIVLCSQAGANHLEKGVSCQDACIATQQFYKGYPYTLLAVADGHGSAAYTRSEVGAHLAMQAVQSTATRFIPYVVELLEEQPVNWRSTAQCEFRNYFGKRVCNEWESLVIRHLNEKPQETTAASGDIFKPYGTTIAVLLLFEDLVLVGTIGDSFIYCIFTNDVPDVHYAFHEDSPVVGLQADSLSSRDAHYKWSTQTISLDDLDMVFLATDGFSDSLKNPKDSVEDMYDKLNINGIDWLKKILPRELKRWSEEGVGDDISIIACFMKRNHTSAGTAQPDQDNFL